MQINKIDKIVLNNSLTSQLAAGGEANYKTKLKVKKVRRGVKSVGKKSEKVKDN